ncbi:MAG: phospholipase D-like domain-containing protein [Bdellovibrionota bacterium]
MSILKKTFVTILFLWGCLVAYNAKADELKYLAHPQESLAAFITLAEQAKVSIDVATFIFEPCHASTQVLIDVLAKRAQAGVKVRLLLDATLHSGSDKFEIANYFDKYGIEVRYYNDYAVYSPAMNLRMHIKFMNVDSHTYISGGRNISDEYFALSTKQNWVDRDVMVTGTSAAQVTKSFNELWNDPMTDEKAGKGSRFKGWTKYCGTNLSTRMPEVRAFLGAKGAGILSAIPSRSCASVHFYTDHPQFGNPIYGERGIYDDDLDTYMTPMRLKMKRTTNRLLKFIASSRESLDMENWGYIPMGYLRQAFSQLRDRHVPVNLIVNQDMESGPKFFQEAEEYAIAKLSGEDTDGSQEVRLISSKGKLSDAFELTPTGVRFLLHSKVFVRDRKDAVVSSFNLDSRSYSTNLESAVVVQDCPDFAGDVKKQIDVVNAIYADDVNSGRIPEKEEAGFFSKLFALFNLTQL